MAFTHEENDLFTRVGPGTPAGQMVPLYWHPIGFAKERQVKPKTSEAFRLRISPR